MTTHPITNKKQISGKRKILVLVALLPAALLFLLMLKSERSTIYDATMSHSSKPLPTNEVRIYQSNSTVSKVAGQHAVKEEPNSYGRRFVLRILPEANNFATALGLDETLPLNESNVLKTFIVTSPYLKASGQLGNITTSNYTYFVNYGNKLSTVDRVDGLALIETIKDQYRSKPCQIDTNAAFGFATNLLSKAFIDVGAIIQDGEVQVVCPRLGGQKDKCIPIYSVYWQSKTNKAKTGTLAFVQFCLPSEVLLEFRVSNPIYNLRKELTISENLLTN